MESDESIDLEDSEVVNAYGSVVAEEEHETPFEHSEEVRWKSWSTTFSFLHQFFAIKVRHPS